MLQTLFRQNSNSTLERCKAVRLRSFKRDGWYNISIEEKTCDCPNFDKKAKGCEHLAALGIYRLRPFTPTTHPTFSQALSALVKSIRIRRAEHAVDWLLLRDRDRIFGRDFRERVRDMDIEEVLSALRSPWQRAYVERVIGSIRRECLDHEPGPETRRVPGNGGWGP